MRKLWDDDAWEEYLEWQKTDKKTLKRINNLLKDIDRNGYNCIGDPEPLSGNLSNEVQLHIRPSSFFWGAAPDSVPAS